MTRYAIHGRKITAPAGNINDTAERAAYRKEMERASIKHAQAIIFSGKAYGPCNPDELLAYAAPKVKLSKAASRRAIENRRAAKEEGLTRYEGDPCGKCETTTRYTRNRTCVKCASQAKANDYEVAVRQERRQQDQAMLDECLQIASRHGYTVTQLKNDSREEGLVSCRHEIFAAMFSTGYSFKKIAEWWNRDRTTVKYAIVKHYPSLVKSKSRTRAVQNFQMDLQFAA